MTHDEMIAVIQAHKEGKTIESRARGIGGAKWVTLNEEPSWQFSEYDYRIKPELFKHTEIFNAWQQFGKSFIGMSSGNTRFEVPREGTYKVTIEEIG